MMALIRRRWRALPFALLLCLPGVGEGYQHGDWELTSDESMVGGFTLDRTGSGVRFIVLLPYGDCSAYSYGLESDGTDGWLEVEPDAAVIELAIDDGFPYRGRLSGWVSVDADRHRLLIHGLANGQTLGAELREGGVLELDLWAGGRRYDLYFSLRGSRAVMDRLGQVCRFARWRRQRDRDFDAFEPFRPDRQLP